MDVVFSCGATLAVVVGDRWWWTQTRVPGARCGDEDELSRFMLSVSGTSCNAAQERGSL